MGLRGGIASSSGRSQWSSNVALRPSLQGMGWHAHALAGSDHRGQKLLACTTRSLLKGRKWGYSLPAQPANQDKKRWVTGSATKAAVANLLLDYTLEGPLLPLCGISQEAVQGNFERWLELANVIIKDLGLPDADQLGDGDRMRIFQYYLPVFFWCWQKVQDWHASHQGAAPRPLIIGMQAVQGCGKTTLVTELENLFATVGVKSASVSIDDFYLPFEGQQALIQANPNNFLLGVRGNALTHDLALGQSTIQQLTKCGRDASGRPFAGSASGPAVRLPRYEKSAHEGRGDRADPSSWPEIQGHLDVVLFEGWMLGFAPIKEEEAAKISQDLVPINDTLAQYVQQWDACVDIWLVIKVADPAYVFRWRQQAEHAMKAAGKGGMTDEQVQDFVNRYMPAYQAYLPGMYAKGPSTAESHKQDGNPGLPDNVLIFEIDESRGLSGSKTPSSAASLQS